jgi:hypothetical protein
LNNTDLRRAVPESVAASPPVGSATTVSQRRERRAVGAGGVVLHLGFALVLARALDAVSAVGVHA